MAKKGRKSAQEEADARAWALLLKHGEERAAQRDHEPGELVRLDLLITGRNMERICELVEELNRREPRRLTRAEVGRHLLSRAIMECARALRREREQEHDT